MTQASLTGRRRFDALPAGLAGTRLLIVDDEPHIRSALRRALGLMDFVTEEAGSGAEALRVLRQRPCDLMVLDMHLPDMNGLDILDHARQILPNLLVVILTGQATLESAIAALKAESVVDYLLKPASVHDVVAGVTRALRKRAEQLEKDRLVQTITAAVDALRQTSSPPALSPGAPPPAEVPMIHAPPLRLDRQKRLLKLDGDPMRTIELTKGEANLLACLLGEPNQVFSCRDLALAALGYHVDEREAQYLIRPYIFRLRQKLEANPRKPHLIRTVRGTGYVYSTPST